MTTAYAGIGSRSTPATMRPVIADVATRCARNGIVLRSGGALGADAMFEYAAKVTGPWACATNEIYLPWPGFNGRVIGYALERPTPGAYEIAAAAHPAWHRCSASAQHLLARNAHQILGRDLASPVAFVVCWTPGGQLVGGTATALRIAQANGIPVCNLATPEGLGWWS
jgi:hypothetical protein